MSGAPAQLVSPQEAKKNLDLTDDYTDPTTNEGNLLSLITLKNILGSEAGVDDTLKAMAKEETRHLMLAMKILTDTGTVPGMPEHHKMAIQKLQEKYGRDMSGAVKLGKLLKTKADEKEVEMMVEPFVVDTLRGKQGPRSLRGGFSLDGLTGAMGPAYTPATGGGR